MNNNIYENLDKREKRKDITTLLVIGVASISLLAGFGLLLHSSNLLYFPDPSPDFTDEPKSIQYYYMESMHYRERRYTLILLFRTYLTAFSFIVGLCLSTMGGLFILRQISTLTSVSANRNGNNITDQSNSGIGKGKFEFSTYSPGIVFLIAGVVVIFITMSFSIQTKFIESFPPETRWITNDEDLQVDSSKVSEKTTKPSDSAQNPYSEQADN